MPHQSIRTFVHGPSESRFRSIDPTRTAPALFIIAIPPQHPQPCCLLPATNMSGQDAFSIASSAFLDWFLAHPLASISPKVELVDLRRRDAGRGMGTLEVFRCQDWKSRRSTNMDMTSCAGRYRQGRRALCHPAAIRPERGILKAKGPDPGGDGESKSMDGMLRTTWS